ncbi:MAG: hypothetical protein NC210_10470 [[Clostridium] fimetarium]|nr:hypothetical protein [Alistipes timonensis]MCM1406836.1 hypothetical protein [[Clostridium] fimetarium]
MRHLSTILLILAASLTFASAGSFKSVPVPEGSVIFSKDSTHVTQSPAAKITIRYRNFYSPVEVTVYADSAGRPLIAIEHTKARKGTRERYDTTLLTTQGMVLRRGKMTTLDGEFERHDVNVVYKSETKWSHYPEYTNFKPELVGTKIDQAGNWTEAHGYFPPNMDPDVSATREVSYTLTPEEADMVSHYEAMRDELSSSALGQLEKIGFLLLAIAVAAAAFTLLCKGLNAKIRGYIAGPLVGLTSCAGIYLSAIYINNRLHSTEFAAILCAVYILALSAFRYKTMLDLEDDRSLSNDEVNGRFVLTGFALLLIGWSIGAELWQTWWAAGLTAGAFSLPIYSVPTRGERCAKCHRVNAVEKVEDIDLGTRIHTMEHNRADRTTYTISTYRKFKSRRRCSYCGYEYITPEKEELVSRKELNTAPKQAPQAPRPKPDPRPASQSEEYKRKDNSLARDYCGYWREYDGIVGGGYCSYDSCKNQCQYPYNCLDCPRRIS